MKEHAKTIERVIKETNSSFLGLDDEKIITSKRLYGDNTIKKSKGKSFFKKITDALLDPMLIILEVAMVITLGVNIGKAFKGIESDFYECIGIIFAIFVSVFLTIFMEGKSQKAFDLLNNIYESQSIKVRRNKEVLLVNKKFSFI